MPVANSPPEYLAVVAQIIPVLVLAAVAVPLRFSGQRGERPRALLGLAVTGFLVGVAALAETVALFGVHQGGLGPADTRILTVLLTMAGALAVVRLLAPMTRRYAAEGDLPELRVWKFVGVLFLAGFVGLLFLLA